MTTRLTSLIEAAAGLAIDPLIANGAYSAAVTILCAVVAVALTVILACLIIPVRPYVAVDPVPGRKLKGPGPFFPALATPQGRLQADGVDTIGKLDVSRLVADRFNRGHANKYLVVDLNEAEAQGRALIYVQNAVYVYPKEFSPDRTYRVQISHPRTGIFALNLRIRPRITASRFDAPDGNGPYLKVAFSAEAVAKYHILNEIIDEVCDIRFDEALSPAQTAWLALRGIHPEADINIGALFVLIGVPVTLISTFLCKWLDRVNPDMLITGGIYLASSLTALLVVYLIRRRAVIGKR
ncbi:MULTISPECIES: hypothetical protein [Asticcacaulis]|uniref:hypothetical protein n=1 Tax=Asticcacaulis TaxID=76890 RepID=UPI001AE369B6|nr:MULTISPECIES: hypothetical protein [Asticcacaulis]MBP2157946.1 hypothetical protein [Asticcacaulis solisilvae]MDR6798991.1 hypothetical protein [Asticcacaulis sp. BE141]